jgi:transcription elongation factor Elf1
MKNALDSQTIEISCPHCGHKLSETIGKLKTNPKLTCTRCKGGISVNATHMRTEITKVEKALLEFQRTLGKLGK